ncbi:hypothetical protein ACFW9X_28220, partial [Streptomyces sp. NPDC059466]
HPTLPPSQTPPPGAPPPPPAPPAGPRGGRALYRRSLAAQERQILEALAADPDFGRAAVERPELRIAVRGWLAFTTAVCLEWLRGAELTREQLRDLCARALLGAIAP